MLRVWLRLPGWSRRLQAFGQNNSRSPMPPDPLLQFNFSTLRQEHATAMMPVPPGLSPDRPRTSAAENYRRRGVLAAQGKPTPTGVRASIRWKADDEIRIPQMASRSPGTHVASRRTSLGSFGEVFGRRPSTVPTDIQISAPIHFQLSSSLPSPQLSPSSVQTSPTTATSTFTSSSDSRPTIIKRKPVPVFVESRNFSIPTSRRNDSISKTTWRPSSPACSSASDPEMATASEGERADGQAERPLQLSSYSSENSSSHSGSPSASLDSFQFFEAPKDTVTRNDEDRSDESSPRISTSLSEGDTSEDDKLGDDASAWTHILSKSRTSVFVERLSLDRGLSLFA